TIAIANNTDKTLREKSIAYLKELVGKVLNLPSTKIDASESLTSYGLDSLLVLQLTNILRTNMLSIGSTLFFEYATIDALVEHLLHTQKETLERLVGISMPPHGQEQHRSNEVENGHAPRRFLTRGQTGSKRDADEDTRETQVEASPILRGASSLLSPERDI